MVSNKLKLILPKGRIQDKVMGLLNRIGIVFQSNGRSLRPQCADKTIETKLLKPQNIPTLVALGRHDCGFTGHDWVCERKADVKEMLDLGFDPVRIVSAASETFSYEKDQRIVVASEYANLANEYIRKKNLNAVFIQSFGATEALPPEDADMIIDNIATGNTLLSNRLKVVDLIMESTTRFVCNKAALEDPVKSKKIEELILLMKSTLTAQSRVLLEMNVSRKNLSDVARILPCMRAPTISPLHNEDGYAIKAAVMSREVSCLITKLIQAGARDILEYRLEKIVDRGAP